MTEELKTQDEVVKNRVKTMAVDNLHPAPTGPGQMALEAIKAGAGKEVLEQLQKAWEIQQEFDRDAARKAYYEAMSQFAVNPPDIDKDQLVEYGTGQNKTSYKHASLGNVAKKIQTALSAYGLHASWQTTQSDKSITVACEISHMQGHSESTSLTAAPDSSGAKNAIQAIGSTVSYLSRYTILALTGLAAYDQDDDGAGSEPVEAINDSMFTDITSLIQEVGADEKRFCRYMKIASIDKMPADMFENAIKTLEAKKK